MDFAEHPAFSIALAIIAACYSSVPMAVTVERKGYEIFGVSPAFTFRPI